MFFEKQLNVFLGTSKCFPVGEMNKPQALF